MPQPADPSAVPPEPEIGVPEILATLETLARRVSSPIVRECLQACRADIAFLAGGEGGEGDGLEGPDGGEAGLPGVA